MSEKASPAGWVIQFSPALAGAKFSFFSVAISDADMAADAIRKKVAAKTDDRVYAVRPLSAAELASTKPKTG